MNRESFEKYMKTRSDPCLAVIAEDQETRIHLTSMLSQFKGPVVCPNSFAEWTVLCSANLKPRLIVIDLKIPGEKIRAYLEQSSTSRVLLYWGMGKSLFPDNKAGRKLLEYLGDRYIGVFDKPERSDLILEEINKIFPEII